MFIFGRYNEESDGSNIMLTFVYNLLISVAQNLWKITSPNIHEMGWFF